ncbi:hypothetical protein ACSTS3_01325 [Aquimarina muelleri]|uniref:hypothetical protein n=1 Tax=Aquimarina muelleri TaxID=279356 RepID=UPI003F686C24
MLDKKFGYKTIKLGDAIENYTIETRGLHHPTNPFIATLAKLPSIDWLELKIEDQNLLYVFDEKFEHIYISDGEVGLFNKGKTLKYIKLEINISNSINSVTRAEKILFKLYSEYSKILGTYSSKLDDFSQELKIQGYAWEGEKTILKLFITHNGYGSYYSRIKVIIGMLNKNNKRSGF